MPDQTIKIQFIIPLIVCFLGVNIYAAKVTENDTSVINELLRKGQNVHYSNPDSAIFYYQSIFDQAGSLQERFSDQISEMDSAYLETIIRSLNYTGNIFYYNDEYKRSEFYYQRSLELAKKSGLKEYEGKALFDIGYVHYMNSDYNTAEIYFSDAYRLFTETGNEYGKYDAQLASGLNHRRLGDFDQSDSCYRESLQIAAGFNDSLMISDTKINLGILLCEQGRLEEGIGLFEEALGYYERINNKRAVSTALLNIGVVMKMVREYDKALSYISKSAAIEEHLQQKSQLVVRYYNLADLYLEMGESDKAYEYCQKIQAVAGEIGSQPFISECNFLMGKYYFMKENYAKANDHFDKATTNAVSNNHKPLIANIYLWHARTSLKEGNLNSAIFLAQNAYLISSEMQLIIVQKETSKILAEAFEKTGKGKMALSWYKTFLDHSNSLSYANQHKEISRIEARYNYEKKEKENELLRDKASLQEQKLRNRNIISIALITGVILSFVIILLLIRKNRDSRLLFEQQQLLSLQHLEEIEGELDGKKRELASKMMFLNQKNELITGLIKRLQEIQHDPDNSNEELISIVNDLRIDAPQSNWKEFETQFTQVHPGFYQRLYEKHPALTSYEQRICAFLRMNLNTKEIASITGRSSKSIEVTRSRIRTKLHLKRDDNLSSFLAAV